MIHVVLVEPEIHWNTGNVGRTCLATGAQLHLVEPLGFSLDEREVRRAGLDYWPRVQPQTWPDWQTFEEALPSLGAPWFFSSAGTSEHWDGDFRGDIALIFGSESVGLPEELLARYAERTLRLTMKDTSAPSRAQRVRSLNLSSVVAVALYEALRQRRP